VRQLLRADTIHVRAAVDVSNDAVLMRCTRYGKKHQRSRGMPHREAYVRPSPRAPARTVLSVVNSAPETGAPEKRLKARIGVKRLENLLRFEAKNVTALINRLLQNPENLVAVT
jgi:hypothetical protein